MTYRQLLKTFQAMLEKEGNFAILSHRWSRNEFVFADIPSSGVVVNLEAMPTNPRPGLLKLTEFCKMAYKRFALQYAWMDTCCIDKGRSAELDQAIRSMFHWYRASTICIVHLAETSSTQVMNMHKDSWWTRCWTLQELLAPRAMKFFDREWIEITHEANDKKSGAVLQQLYDATGIRPTDLERFIPGPINIRQRLVWASKRRATQVEDEAYSLVGIFNVQLRVAYGEGHRAFQELQKVLLTVSGERGMFAWDFPPRHVRATIPGTPIGTSIFAPSPSAFQLSNRERHDSMITSIFRSPIPLARIPETGLDITISTTNIGVRMQAPLYSVRRIELRAKRIAADEVTMYKFRIAEIETFGELKKPSISIWCPCDLSETDSSVLQEMKVAILEKYANARDGSGATFAIAIVLRPLDFLAPMRAYRPPDPIRGAYPPIYVRFPTSRSTAAFVVPRALPIHVLQAPQLVYIR